MTRDTMAADAVLLGTSVFHGSFPESRIPLSWQVSGSETGRRETDVVNLAELKDLARKLLKKESTFRKLILEEPDRLPRIIAIVKVEMYLKLLHKELEDVE